MAKLDKFTQGYIEAALWSSTAYGSPEENEQDPADENGDRHSSFNASFESCGYDELSPELLAHVIDDCAAFQADNLEQLECASAQQGYTYTAESAGHDFWLTRNRHGAGFWDRGLGKVGQQLTEAAHVYGEETWYLDCTDPEAPVIRNMSGD